MKRKGFTLIELLAVIVILAVIGLITISIIGNIIEDSRKKALESSVQGIVEAARYFTLSNDGTYKFIFSDTVQGKTEEGNYTLDYKGQVDATGELYIDNNGNISLCFMNENYYVYKNYNSGIYIGEVSEDTCIIDYDTLTTEYIAMLDDGTGSVSNVYSKTEVDSLVTNLQSQIDANESNINTVTSIANTNKNNIELMQEELSKYALQSDLDATNMNISDILKEVSENSSSIDEIMNKLPLLSVKQVHYKTDNKSEALSSINNFTGQEIYLIYFVDSVGDSPLGGGNSLIIGYSAGSDYGVQISMKYNSGGGMLKIRDNYNATWSSWKTVFLGS